MDEGKVKEAAFEMLHALEVVVGLKERKPIPFTNEEKIKICLNAINRATGSTYTLSSDWPESKQVQINQFLKSVR
ncbi:hypothetical protein [Sphingobacterium multivorum]|uniref:hypothetical protein n=1 Tax=Sphingobacterium multivorum TaxID=28454 RepID=UPI0028AC3D41|nr:hypothetical protein [Sphingobacterium multivorum]